MIVTDKLRIPIPLSLLIETPYTHTQFLESMHLNEINQLQRKPNLKACIVTKTPSNQISYKLIADHLKKC